MNQKKKGFTLVELLAIIIILGIIAVIAVPKIKHITETAKKEAFINSAYGIIKAGNLYYSRQEMMGNITDDITINFPDSSNILELQGKVPNGSIKITKEGKIAIAVYNKKYCITKYIDDKDITIKENFKYCSIIPDNDGPVITLNQEFSTSIDHPTPISNDSITISGTVIDDNGVELLKVNGKEVNVDKNGLWTTTLTLTKGIVTKINITSIDVAENTTELNRYVGYIEYTTFAITTDNRTMIGYSGTENEELIIPETFYDDVTEKWYKVTEIKHSAFENCNELTKVIIPDSVTSIGFEAFKKCTKLSNVKLSTGLIEINSNIFSSCTSITSIGPVGSGADIEIPDSVTIINGTFQKCSNLSKVVIPNSVTTIDSSSFAYNNNLTEVTIGTGVTNIKSWAFAPCEKLTKVIFSNPNGWLISNGTTSESIDVSDPTNAANYLKNTSTQYEWIRNNS